MAGGARQTRSFEAFQAYFDEKFSEMKDIMATKDCIQKLHTTIENQNDKIQILESRIAVMERHINQLQGNVDDNEQYSRRLCLRINGIPPVPKGQNANCRLCAKIGEEFHYINSEEDLQDIIREYEERSATRSVTRNDTSRDTEDQQDDHYDDENGDGANKNNSG
eukprot:gene10423-19125_t